MESLIPKGQYKKIKTAEEILAEANYFAEEEEMKAIISFMEKYAEQFKSQQVLF